jgi:DNA-binding HxlR family transcriptional regulator
VAAGQDRSDQKSAFPGITPAIATQGILTALTMLEGRWKLNILFELFGGRVLRFSELEHAISGITQKMLAQQLRALAESGLVLRTMHPTVPPRVEYA